MTLSETFSNFRSFKQIRAENAEIKTTLQLNNKRLDDIRRLPVASRDE